MLVNSLSGLPNPMLLHGIATDGNFNERDYLASNPDVAEAVKSSLIESGRKHFELHGKAEGRRINFEVDLIALKKSKLARIKPILRDDMELNELPDHYDFLTDELRRQCNIIDTNAVSSNDYDNDVKALIEKHQRGILLDCGAGSRSLYYQNVVNFEVAAYRSTDVRGVGEVLPFRDQSFDAVISIAVLEHVKDPWRCAQEILRVLKPGGDLLCCVPFLQPLHGYPHHYYNMSGEGLRNLFEPAIEILKHEVPPSVLPIWTLTWILQSWASGLTGESLRQFKQMTVAELMNDPVQYLQMPFVRDLPIQKNFELASATVIHGRKLEGHRDADGQGMVSKCRKAGVTDAEMLPSSS